MYQKIRTYAIHSLLLFAVLGIFISGCADSKSASFAPTPEISATDTSTDTSTDPTSTDTTTNTSTIQTTLTWDAPTTYTDGSPLPPGDIKEYRVYFSAQSNNYSAGSYQTVTAPATSITATGIISQPSGTYYFVVTAVDKTDMESDHSNEVSKAF